LHLSSSLSFDLVRLLSSRPATTKLLIESHLCRGGFPHSDICGSKLVCQLPAAFRRLPRPSSPVIAKASTTCTYSLDPITLNPLARTFQLQVYFSAWLPSPHLAMRPRYNHQTQSLRSRLKGIETLLLLPNF